MVGAALTCLIQLSLTQNCVVAQDLDFDRYERLCRYSIDERELLSDMDDGRLNVHSAVEGALIIAHHSEQKIDLLERRLQHSIKQCRRRLAGVQRADWPRAIFDHLRIEFLHGEYDPHLFDLQRTIEQGEFNCLSATILYQAMCREFSVVAQAAWEPSHVRCWVREPLNSTRGFVIETTSAKTKDAQGPTLHQRLLDDRLLSDVQLIAKVFYNRGVQALKRDDYPNALACTWASAILDPQDAPAQSNLRACFNNWALFAAEKDNKLLARQLFSVGLKLDPNYAPFLRNRTILIGQ